MKINKVEQIKNENGTFAYVFDGVIHTKQSKKDYSYCIPEIGSFSNSLKSIQSVQLFWYKNGNEGVNKDNLQILQIVKN